MVTGEHYSPFAMKGSPQLFCAFEIIEYGQLATVTCIYTHYTHRQTEADPEAKSVGYSLQYTKAKQTKIFKEMSKNSC